MPGRPSLTPFGIHLMGTNGTKVLLSEGWILAVRRGREPGNAADLLAFYVGAAPLGSIDDG